MEGSVGIHMTTTLNQSVENTNLSKKTEESVLTVRRIEALEQEIKMIEARTKVLQN